MTKKHLLYILIISTISFTSCTIRQGSIENPAQYFNKMSWMCENWLNQSPGILQIETWSKEKDNNIKIEQHIVMGKDTIFDEYANIIFLEQENNIIYKSEIGKYIQEDEEIFKLTFCSKRKVIFENHNTKHSITYQKKKNDNIKITLTTVENNEYKTQSYLMQKAD